MVTTATQFMTTRQLAHLWKVSEATIKRWADAGALRASRTLGGHRRFSLEEVTRFQTERGLTAATATKAALEKVSPAAALATASPGGAESDFVEDFFASLAAGHEASATAVLLEAYLGGVGLTELLDVVVAGALHSVGDKWQAGELTVADEHLATRTATHAIETLRNSIRRADAGAGLPALCCAAEEELHELPALCAQTVLESEGWRVRNLGANTPFFALADAVERHRPRLVCVSSTTRGALAGAERDYGQFLDAARSCGARVVLGGESFRGAGMREKFPADLHAESFAELLRFIREEAQ